MQNRDFTFDLIVIIVNWNVRELLQNCLQSLCAAIEGIKVEIVVVDNNSADGSVEMVRQRFPGVRVIANTSNVGFARANNQALEAYRGQSRNYVLLNPDTVVSPETFRAMIGFMDGHPEAGMIGCKIVKPDGTLDWPCKRSYISPSIFIYKALGLDRRFPKSRRFGRYHLTYLDPDAVHEVDSLVGAFIMIRDECLNQIGGLDESFFIYGEDCDWCYRAKGAGWRVYYVPSATIVHHKGQSTGKVDRSMIRHWYLAAWQLYKKHRAARYPSPVNLIVWSGCKIMCAVSLLANSWRAQKGVPNRGE